MPDTRFAKFVVAVNCGVPLAVLGWDAGHGYLGANAVNYAIKTTGLLAVIFITLSLTVTPLRKLSGLSWLVQFRRALGVSAFVYAAMHFLVYFFKDQQANVGSTAFEITHRWYLTVGFIGLLIMLPLALTSTNGMIRRLGPKRWQQLHRATYVAAIAAVTHYYMQAKADKRQPIVFAAVLGALLLYRVIAHYVDLRRRANAAALLSTAGGVEPRRKKYWTGELRVAKVFDETADVRTFRLVPVDGGPLPFDYRPGQYLNLRLDVDGQTVPRSYTIASSPTQRDYCEITVKRESLGNASRHLHDTQRQGRALKVAAPAGRFTFTGVEAAGVVLVAGGVGVTPMMSIVRYLTDRCWGGPIDLFFSVRTGADVIFRDELAALARRFPNLHVHVTATRADDAWTGPRGRVTADLVREHVADLPDRLVYLCGPESMLEPMRRLFTGLGVPADRVRSEDFKSPSTAHTAAGGPADTATADAETVGTADAAGVGTVTFARSGKTAPLDGGPVLEAAEAVGVTIDFECRAGTCGTCKTRLLSGHVTMPVQDALTARDHAAGYVLACQATSDEAVTVDA